MELGLEPARDELGGGERVAGGGVPLLLTGPVGLTHHEAELSHPCLGPPLLDVSPPHLAASTSLPWL